jgi:hypothetical protein
MRPLLLLWAVIFGTIAWLNASDSAGSDQLTTGRGPANATTLRDYYREINALSGDPALNGTAKALA